MNNLPVDATIVGLTAAITQFLKPYLELRLKPTDVLHDSTIQLLAVLLALGFRLLEFGVPLTGPDVITLLGYGIGTGATAVGVYHLVSTVTSKAPADPAPTPPSLDYAALAASLAPALTRLAPAVPAYTFPATGNRPAVPFSGAGDQRGTAVAPEPAPQSPSPVPVAPETPPA